MEILHSLAKGVEDLARVVLRNVLSGATFEQISGAKF